MTAAVITAGRGDLIRVAVPATGTHREIDTASRTSAPVAGLRIGGRPAVVTWREGVTFWDVTDGSVIGGLPRFTDDDPHSIASWPDTDGMLALLHPDGTVSRSNASTGERLPCGMRARTTSPHTLTGLVTSDRRRLLALSDAEAVDLWDVDADGLAGPPLAEATDRNLVATAEPGVLVTVSNQDDAVTVWRVDRARPEPAGHTATVTALAIAPDGRAVVGGSDGIVRWWSTADGTAGAEIGRVFGGVNTVAARAVDGETVVLAASCGSSTSSTRSSAV